MTPLSSAVLSESRNRVGGKSKIRISGIGVNSGASLIPNRDKYEKLDELEGRIEMNPQSEVINSNCECPE